MLEDQKKPTMAEALGTRMDEKETTISNPTIPKKPLGEVEQEQTEDEIVHQALLEEQTEQAILSREPPQIVSPSGKSSDTIPTQPEIVTTSSHPEKVKHVIPASSIDLLHATENSTPEFPEPLTEEILNKTIGGFLDKYPNGGVLDLIAIAPPIKDPNLRRLIEYIHSGEYSITWVQLHITSISSFPRVLPTPTIWDIPNDYDVAKLVYEVVLQPGFIETVWPYLRLLLGSSKDNVNWAAGVLTTIALFEAIKLLPYANKSAEEKQ